MTQKNNEREAFEAKINSFNRGQKLNLTPHHDSRFGTYLSDHTECAFRAFKSVSQNEQQEVVAWMIWWDDDKWLFTGDREDFDTATKNKFPITPLFTSPPKKAIPSGWISEENEYLVIRKTDLDFLKERHFNDRLTRVNAVNNIIESGSKRSENYAPSAPTKHMLTIAHQHFDDMAINIDAEQIAVIYKAMLSAATKDSEQRIAELEATVHSWELSYNAAIEERNQARRDEEIAVKFNSELQAHVNQLREALEFYADGKNYTEGLEMFGAQIHLKDYGQVAKKALSSTPAQSLAEYGNTLIERCKNIVANDPLAITFQSMGAYRSEIIRQIGALKTQFNGMTEAETSNTMSVKGLSVGGET